MKKYLRNTKLLLPALMVSLFFCTVALGQKTWTRGAGNDNWSSANNWSPVGVPTASDAVTIADNTLFTAVKIDINASCASLTINGGVYPLTVTVKTGVTFNVVNTSGGTGLISIGAPADGSSDKIILVGEYLGLHTSPVVNCVAVTMADVIIPFSDDNSLQIWSGIVAISGNLTLNGSQNRVFVDRGKLVIGGTFNNGGSLVTTNFSESTVEYNGANQVMRSGTYSNLIVSGSGTKSNAVTVNEKLSIQGTAILTGTITYGNVDPALEYKGSMAQITSNFEFPVNMPARVIINNPAGVGLNSNKIIAKELILTSGNLIAGNKLSMGANETPVITRAGGSMTGTLQTPANDYDVVYTGNSKTTGAELSSGGLKNITVNLSAATETLTLNQTTIPDGDLYISKGIFNLSTFTINRSAAAGILTVTDSGTLKTGGINSLPANYTYALSQNSVVEYTGTNQTVNATTYGKLIASGTGIKTLSTAAATVVHTITIQAGVTFIIDAADFTASYFTNISGTLKSTSVTGTKGFRDITVNNGGLFNSTVDEDYRIVRHIIVNGTGNIISGAGVWSFVSTVNPGIMGGTAPVFIKNIRIQDGRYEHTGLFTCEYFTIVSANFSNASIFSIFLDLTMFGGYYRQKINSTLNFSGSSIHKADAAIFMADSTGNTVNFSRTGDQTLNNAITFNNLTLSGSGSKYLYGGNTINGILSIQGTAVTNLGGATPNYGPNATLEYAGSTAQTTTDIEFKSAGGAKNVTINNPNGVTLHASKTLAGTLTLTNGLLNIPAGNVLTLAGSNAVAGSFGATTHINTMTTLAGGEAQAFLKVSNIPTSSAYLFPTGNGTYYLPATLTPGDVPANNTFSINAFQGITTTGLPGGAPVANKTNLVEATWIINNNVGAATAAVTMTLGWPNALEGSGFSALADNMIGISHFDNPAWGSYTGSGNQVNNTATRTNITEFSPFSVGMIGTLLRGTNYLQPVNKENTQKQNTVIVYEPIKSVSLSPNPVSNFMQLRVVCGKKEKIELAIVSAEGKIIYKKITELQPGSNNTRLDVGGLSKGMYFIKIFRGDEQHSVIKFIKN